MNENLPMNRKLIREYFEYLKNAKTTTEPLAKQVIADFLAHRKEGKSPKEGIWVYIIGVVLLLSLLISPIVTFLLVLLSLLLVNLTRSIKIKPPVDSDKQIDQWLLEDKRKLFKNVPYELNVIVVGDSENTPEVLNVVMNEDYPIQLSSGFILEPDDKFLKTLIDADYFVEKGLDNKTRYSIHVFMEIFLCRNFLAYYKCYWNFIKGVAILVETGEYLYDTIVSVSTQELSAATGNSEGQKLILKKILRINTTDGKEIEFPAITDIRVRYESSLENDIPSVRDAAHIIREMLRERRIDMQIVKPFDTDD